MVKSRDMSLSSDGGLSKRFEHLRSVEHDEGQALQALAQQIRAMVPCKQYNRGVELVEVLDTLSMDLETLQAGLLYPCLEREALTLTQIEQLTNARVAKLLRGVLQMRDIRRLQHVDQDSKSNVHIDNLRKMLLAMADDVRVMVIKLAERVCELRTIKDLDETEKILLAKETATIYAPLANRLGIGQLKWELEDLSFRYLHPDIYKSIATLLSEKRLIREQYIHDFTEKLEHSLRAHHIQAQVYGRPKHIYSIWRKMHKKNIAFEDLHDVLAVRIVTEKTHDCYAALGVVHGLWHPIPREFDDYIANPKPNGYRSIHTVVVGSKGRSVEIQIRTKHMHEDAELGVAAHWKYKEGLSSARPDVYEDKIAWLRKLLIWQDDMSKSEDLIEELRNQVFEERVYVFTPKGDIFDLPKGATPLDFAYYIHSEIGHRCIGAKADGRIVSFQYRLKTGDQIEIITQKHPNPRRDWLNPHLGFIQTSRARSKISAWFKHQDRDKNILAGREWLEKELERHDLNLSQIDKTTLTRFNIHAIEDLFASIGAGDLRVNQLLNYLNARYNQPDHAQKHWTPKEKQSLSSRQENSDILVHGVGNLMTHLAQCCQPLPGDNIVGFITQGRGISIHRRDCEQLAMQQEQQPERVISAHWGEASQSRYTLKIQIQALNRTGLFRDITAVIANEKTQVLTMNSRRQGMDEPTVIDLTLEVATLDVLNRILSKVSQVKDVISVYRI